MKKLTLLTIVSVFSIATFAHTNAIVPGAPSKSKAYLMMKKGKLIEVNHGKRRAIIKDVTLVNQTTIHPNGSIDASSGQNLQLKEGECITMDGRIRKTKDLPKSYGH